MADSRGTESARMRDAGSPLSEFIAPFLAPGRGLGEKSRRDYARYLREFDAFTGHSDLRTALTLENGKRFRERLKERGRSASRNGTMYLKSFARWVAETEVLARPDGGSIFDALKAPKTPKTKRQALTEEDLDAIWAVLADRSKRERYRAIALVRLLDATGARRTAVGSVSFNDVEFDGSGGWVTVRRSAKVGPDRVRLDADAVGAIRRYIDRERPEYEGRPPEPLFLNEHGRRFTSNGFGTWLDRIGNDIEKATGIKWNTELMRHTWKEEGKAPFRDPEIRSSCMEILNGEGNYDQAVMAACKVLEERVRVASGAPSGQRSGVQLMRFAFGGDKPPLLLSSESSEQRGAMEMYAGLMSYYRNPAAHRIRDDLDKYEVTRIVSWIDHLLTLVGRAGPFAVT